MDPESRSAILLSLRRPRGTRSAREEALEQSLQAELLRDRALSLSRAGHRLEAAWTRLQEIEAAWASCDDATAANRLRDDWKECLQAARNARWELMVQREAMGLRHHHDLDGAFPLPRRSALPPRPVKEVD